MSAHGATACSVCFPYCLSDWSCLTWFIFSEISNELAFLIRKQTAFAPLTPSFILLCWNIQIPIVSKFHRELSDYLKWEKNRKILLMHYIYYYIIYIIIYIIILYYNLYYFLVCHWWFCHHSYYLTLVFFLCLTFSNFYSTICISEISRRNQWASCSNLSNSTQQCNTTHFNLQIPCGQFWKQSQMQNQPINHKIQNKTNSVRWWQLLRLISKHLKHNILCVTLCTWCSMCWLNVYILINTDIHFLLLEVQEPSVLL